MVVNPPMSADKVVWLLAGIAETPRAWGGCLSDPNTPFNEIFKVGSGNPNAS